MMLKKTLLHILYTVVAVLFINALFMVLESAVSFSDAASIVYAIAKYLAFLITISVSVSIFRKHEQHERKESTSNLCTPEPAINIDNTEYQQKDSVVVYTEEDLQDFCEGHPLIDDFLTKVVGVTYKNDDGTSRQEVLSHCLRGEPVSFRNYLYDGKPAYAVITDHGQIGNLSANLAESMDFRYGPDSYISGTISDITGGENGLYYGCMLHVFIYGPSEKRTLQTEHDY